MRLAIKTRNSSSRYGPPEAPRSLSENVCSRHQSSFTHALTNLASPHCRDNVGHPQSLFVAVDAADTAVVNYGVHMVNSRARGALSPRPALPVLLRGVDFPSSGPPRRLT